MLLDAPGVYRFWRAECKHVRKVPSSMSDDFKIKVIVADEFAGAVSERLGDDAERVELLRVTADGSSEAELSGADALLRAGLKGSGFRRLLDAATGLRWLH